MDMLVCRFRAEGWKSGRVESVGLGVGGTLITSPLSFLYSSSLILISMLSTEINHDAQNRKP